MQNYPLIITKYQPYLFHRFKPMYRHGPKFSDRYAWANSADPDQTEEQSDQGLHCVCHSVCIVWTHYSMVEPHSSDFRVITTNFLGVRIFRKFTVPTLSVPLRFRPMYYVLQNFKI